MTARAGRPEAANHCTSGDTERFERVGERAATSHDGPELGVESMRSHGRCDAEALSALREARRPAAHGRRRHSERGGRPPVTVTCLFGDQGSTDDLDRVPAPVEQAAGGYEHMRRCAGPAPGPAWSEPSRSRAGRPPRTSRSRGQLHGRSRPPQLGQTSRPTRRSRSTRRSLSAAASTAILSHRSSVAPSGQNRQARTRVAILDRWPSARQPWPRAHVHSGCRQTARPCLASVALNTPRGRRRSRPRRLSVLLRPAFGRGRGTG